MSDPEARAVQANRDLKQLGAKFAVVGGLAVGFHAGPRTTKDVDFAVAVRDDNYADGIIFGMRDHGYVPVDVILHADTGRIAMVRLSLPRSGAVGPDLNLLFATTGIEPEIVRAAKPVEIVRGVVMPTAARGHLIAAKFVSYDEQRRPQDRIDILGLLKKATSADVTLARKAVKLIKQRGYNRGRDLAGDLAKFVEVMKKQRAT